MGEPRNCLGVEIVKNFVVFAFGLAFVLLFSVERSHGEMVTFDDLLFGSTNYSTDVNGDGTVDIIFETTHEEGLEPGFAPSPSLIQGPGLKAASTFNLDLQVLFPHGVMEYLRFDFALTTYQDEPGGHVYFWIYDADGWPIGSSHQVFAHETGDPARHEATARVELPKSAASAKFNFVTMGGGSWFVVDNFEGSFSTPTEPPAEGTISVSPNVLDFGEAPIGIPSEPLRVTVSNTGNADLDVTGISTKGQHSSQFTLNEDTCSDRKLLPSESGQVDVVFEPTSIGTKVATLSIPSNDADVPVLDVSLSGTGVPAITSILPASVQAGGSILISGRGFGNLRYVKIGPRKFKKASQRILLRADDSIVLLVPEYSNWPDGVSKERMVAVAVKTADGVVKSNRFPLEIRKP